MPCAWMSCLLAWPPATVANMCPETLSLAVSTRVHSFCLISFYYTMPAVPCSLNGLCYNKPTGVFQKAGRHWKITRRKNGFLGGSFMCVSWLSYPANVQRSVNVFFPTKKKHVNLATQLVEITTSLLTMYFSLFKKLFLFTFSLLLSLSL